MHIPLADIGASARRPSGPRGKPLALPPDPVGNPIDAYQQLAAITIGGPDQFLDARRSADRECGHAACLGAPLGIVAQAGAGGTLKISPEYLECSGLWSPISIRRPISSPPPPSS